MNQRMNKNGNWWKRFFGGFGATSTRVRKRTHGLRVESLESRNLLSINLGAADLSYLLEQVNIGNDYAQFFGPLDPNGVREVSGANNNLVGGFTYNADGTVTWNGNNINPDWGRSDTDFLRFLATDHPNNGTSYGFTYDPVTMQVIDSGDGAPILGADGQPVIVPADLATQFAEAAIPAPGTSPRTVTQLITNSDVDPASPTYNPAAYAAMVEMGGEPVEVSNTVVGTAQTAFIPDPGVLGGVPFNDFFAMFGQFFDHGLDFITKGGGFVLTPLSPTDPLYDPSATGPTANMMMLSRGALSNPASDFTIDEFGNAVLNDGVAPAFNNNTGLLIDQSQTYGSHSTINVLLRQYGADGIVTGKLITGAEDGNGSDHGLATFADMKVNAARLGIELTDMDVLDAPMIRADGVGKITFTPQQTVMYRSDLSIAGMGAGYNAANDPFVRWTQADADAKLCLQSQVGYAKKTGHAIISDMGNAASPMSPMGTALTPMGTTDPAAVPGPGQYNEALLASHHVSGDHRVNENAGLTAIHHVFHEEHNIQAGAIMDAVTEQAALLGGQAGADYLAQWQTAPGVWDGEKIYQAARIITESEYNHIAIDQYVGGFVVLPEFVSYSADINMGISLEFSQAVFRLGHSQNSEKMLVAVPDGNGVNPGEPGYVPTFEPQDLFDAFLNPSFFQDYGPSGIVLGLLNQHANAVDEFVTSALQQTTVGIPLDLGAIDIARGRDVGLPTLNEMRQQIFDGLLNNTSNNSNGWGIAPYTSWEDFGGHLRHPESLVNFIAAYGREDDVFGLATMRRAYEDGAASGTDSLGAFDASAYDPTPGDGVITLQDLRANAQVILDAAANQADPLHDAAVLFLRGQGSPVYDPVSGAWNPNNTAGGDEGFWDIDLWVGGLAEQPLFDAPLGTTFSFIMADFGQRMQDADRFYYLYRMPVGHHLGDQIIGEQFADLIMRTTGLEHIGDAFGIQSATFILDGTNNDNPYDGVGAADTYGVNDYFNAIYETLPDGVTSANDGHIIVAGLEGDDYIVAALGDDYVYGDAGNDVIEGAQGNDHLYGGPGDDWITDYENDDFIHGGAGNDYISAGPGALDTAHGGDGDDEIHGGDGIDEVFGDDGDDMLFGEGDTDLMEGGDGHDYMDGGDSVDEEFGGNGNDWLRGGVGDDGLNGGSGNDLMEGGLGPAGNDGDRLVGDSPITLGVPVFEFNGDGTEGDMDIGSYEEVQIAIFANMQTANANGTSSNLLDTYALIEGLVGSAQNDTLTGADANGTALNGVNNYLIGGAGNDALTGLGDDHGLDPATGLPAPGRIDYIFGDSVVVDNDLYWIGDDRHVATGHGNVTGFLENWKGTGETRVVFQDGSLGHVLGDNGAGGVDTAIYRGNLADYNIEVIVVNGQHAIRITDLRDPGVATFDGTDILVGIESATFADQTFSMPPMVTISQAAGQGDPTSASPIYFTVVFSEAVTGFDDTDVILDGTAGATTAAVTPTADPLIFDVAVSGMTTDGTVIASIPAGAAQNAAGELNIASSSIDNTVTYDSTSPTVTIQQGAAQADPTYASPIHFTVVFSEPVTGFDNTDVTLDGTAGATMAQVSTTDNITFTVAVSGMTDNGTVIANIAPGVAQDAAGNLNLASTTTDNTVTYDTTVLANLLVTSFTQTPTGFAARFNYALDTSVLNLYSGQGVDFGAADVTVTSGGNTVAGSLVLDADNQGFSFVKTGGPLAAGTYTITLNSGNNAFVSPTAGPLDGNADGTVGDNYTNTLTVAAIPGTTAVLSIADFARGPGQPVVVPASTGTGLPIYLTSTAGITSLAFDVLYDPALLTITGGSGGSNAPGGANVSVTYPSAGVAHVTYSSSTTTPGTNKNLVTLTAAVPTGVALGSKAVLNLANVTLLNGATPITTIADAGVQVAAFLGDANGVVGPGQTIYQSIDAQRVQRVVVNTDTGFAAYPMLDPVILADVAGGSNGTPDGSLSTIDVQRIWQRAVGENRVEIPALPAVLPPAGTATGPDPNVFISTNLAMAPGGVISVPVEFLRPASETGVNYDLASLDLTIQYPNTLLTVTNADIQAGTITSALNGWFFLGSVADLGGGVGEIHVSAFALTGSNPDQGTLAVIDFTASPAASGTASLDLRGTGTVLYDNANGLPLLLTPAPADGANATDGLITFTTNSPPVLDPIPNQTIDQTAPLAFTATATDADLPAQSLTFSLDAASAAKGMVIDGTSGAFSWTPSQAEVGATYSVTVTVTDNGTPNLSDAQTFSIKVNAPPTLAGVSKTVNEDVQSAFIGADFTAGFSDLNVDDSLQAVKIVTLPAHGTLTLSGAPVAQDDVISAANLGSLSYLGSQDYFGPDSFTWDATDGRLYSGTPATMNLTVSAVNDVPSFTKGGDAAALEDGGQQTVAGWATALSAGPANESGQTLTFVVVSNTNAALFAAGPAVDGVTGDLTFTPAPNANGTATISVAIQDSGGTANGGVNTSASQSFTITVAPVNDAPTFTKGADVTVAEDSGAASLAGWATAMSPGPADESGQSVNFQVVSNSNAALFAVAPAIDAVTGNLTFTPAANANGMATITLALQDNGGTADGGVDVSPSQTFTITVTPVNDVPSFTKGADAAALEDSGPQTVAGWATAISAGPANESSQTLTFLVVSNSNAALFAAGPAIDGVTGDLTFTPAPNANGTATIEVAIQDNGGTADGGVDTSPPQTFTITVTAVNDAPSFTKGADVTALEDSGAQSFAGWATAMSPGPSDESGQSVNFQIVGNSNAALFAAAPAIDAVTGNLTFTPAANANGMAMITLALQDNGGTGNGGVDTSASQTFTITVTPVNDVPSFTEGADASAREDSGPQSVAGWATAISAGPVNESSQTLTFLVLSNSNAALFAAGPAIDGVTGNLTYTPAPNANGTATIEVAIQDNGGTADGGVDTSAPQSFAITVTPVNDPPSFTKGADVSVLEDSGASLVPAWATAMSAGPVDEAGQTLTFLVVSNSNAAMFSAGPAIDPVTGDLTFTPAPDANGAATITVAIQDNGGTVGGGGDTSATQSLTITVTPVNDAPSFVKGADHTSLEDAGPQTVAGWAGAISAGPANEAAQVLDFAVNNDNPSLFAVPPAVAPDGTLTYTAAPDAFGTANVTVQLFDDGGTANLGQDASAPATFVITVDGLPPAVTINQAAGQPAVAAGDPIHFTAQFTDPVTGFDAADVLLSGTATGTLAAQVTQADLEGMVYDVAVTGVTGRGTLVAQVAGGAAVDRAGHASGASTSTDNEVFCEPPQVSDNADASCVYVGAWRTHPGYRGDALVSRNRRARTTTDWSFEVTPGQYQVLATWTAGRRHATKAPFTVLDGGVPTAKATVNQRRAPSDVAWDGVGWEDVGTFEIHSSSLAVELSARANGWVDADAVRIVRVGDLTPTTTQVLDNRGFNFATRGAWSGIRRGYDGNARRNGRGGGAETATWTFLVDPGEYVVAATWPGVRYSANNSPFTVTGDTTFTTRLNQRIPPDDFTDAGVAWENLGTVTVSGNVLSVQLSDLANGPVTADAIRIEKVTPAAARTATMRSVDAALAAMAADNPSPQLSSLTFPAKRPRSAVDAAFAGPVDPFQGL